MKLSTFDAFKHLEVQGAVVLDEIQLKQLQRYLLSILDDVLTICEENNLVWFLYGGSALGAMRHQGFIPWDDDIDINMPRNDYDCFLSLFRHRYGDKYWIQVPGVTPGYPLLMTKIRKKGTCMRTRDDFGNDECGICVDVFVEENTYDDRLRRTIHGVGSVFLEGLLSCRKFYRDRRFLLPLAEGNKQLQIIFRLKIAIGFLLAWKNIDFWTKAALCWCTQYKNHNSRYMVSHAARRHFFGEIHLRIAYCSPRNTLFEGRKVCVPGNVEEYLDSYYGDWHTFPTVDEREKHIVFELRL